LNATVDRSDAVLHSPTLPRLQLQRIQTSPGSLAGQPRAKPELKIDCLFSMAVLPTGDSRAVFLGWATAWGAVRKIFPGWNLSSDSAAQSHRLGRLLSQRCSLTRQSLRRSNPATNVGWETAQPSEQSARDSLLPACLATLAAATLAAATQQRWFCGGGFVAAALPQCPYGGGNVGAKRRGGGLPRLAAGIAGRQLRKPRHALATYPGVSNPHLTRSQPSSSQPA
jgi:hypothetical protein